MSWLRSSFCNADSMTGNCVEVEADGGEVLIRDSKDPDGDVLVFTADEFAAFLLAVKAGEFDVLT